MEGGGTAKRQRIDGRAVSRYPWEGKTMEGMTPPPLEYSAFLDTLGRYGAVVAGLSLGVGAGHQEPRDGSPRRLRHPVDDTTPISEPLHGRGRRRATFPGHTGSPNTVKETGKVQAKQSKRAKANNESKIIQVEFYISMARK